MDRKKKIEIYKQRVFNNVRNGKNISGIHNYCDRWCERCAFTSRCAVYDMELQSKADNENNDIANESFWEELSLVFEVTKQMIKEKAAEMGIDLNDIASIEEIEHIESEAEKVSHKYSNDVHKWLKENRDYIEKKTQVVLSIGEETAISLKDAIEVVDWYSIFISAKIHRAFSGLDDEQDDFMIEEVNLTAKIALIAVTRSMEVFSYLYSQLPEKEDDILNFLASLSLIKRLMTAAFPHAMSYKRPGFDD